VLKDGTLETSDYSQRFPDAPPPLPVIEDANGNFQIDMHEIHSKPDNKAIVVPTNNNDNFPKK